MAQVRKIMRVTGIMLLLTFLMLISMPFILETGSSLFLKMYYKYVFVDPNDKKVAKKLSSTMKRRHEELQATPQKPQEAEKVEAVKDNEKVAEQDKKATYTRILQAIDEEAFKDYHQWHENAFMYRSLLQYGHYPYKSKHLNVIKYNSEVSHGGGGILPPITYRSTGQTYQKDGLPEFVVWMFGGSPLFAPESRDMHTLPGFLEKNLNEEYPNFNIKIFNFAKVGYNSSQSMILFIRLLSMYDHPDLVITFNGWNDMNGFSDGYKMGMMEDQLTYYWEMHQRKGLINWGQVVSNIRGYFPQTLTLLDKASKYLTLKYMPLDTFKAEYISRSEEYDRKFLEEHKKTQKLFLQNIEAMIATAKSKGMSFIAMQVPTFYSSTKEGVSWWETYWLATKMTTTFAQPKQKILSAKTIDRFAFQQLYDRQPLLSIDSFKKAYKDNNEKLQKLAENYGAGYVNVQEILNLPEYKWEPLFIGQAHITGKANEILSRYVADKIRKAVIIGENK